MVEMVHCWTGDRITLGVYFALCDILRESSISDFFGPITPDTPSWTINTCPRILNRHWENARRDPTFFLLYLFSASVAIIKHPFMYPSLLLHMRVNVANYDCIVGE